MRPRGRSARPAGRAASRAGPLLRRDGLAPLRPPAPRARRTTPRAGGPVWPVLEPHLAPGRGGALALRLMAAVHRLVLTGRAPALARPLPERGRRLAGSKERGRPCATWSSARATRSARSPRGRARRTRSDAALRCCSGSWRTAARTGLPFRLLEVGASAGLNLRWDRFRYGGGGAAWGPRGQPRGPLRPLGRRAPFADARIEVVERRGCDLHPLDPGREEDRLTLHVLRVGRPDRALRAPAGRPGAGRARARGRRRRVAHEWLPEQLARAARRGHAPSCTTRSWTSTCRTSRAGRSTAPWTRRARAPPRVRRSPGSASSRRRRSASTRSRSRLWPGGEERRLALSGAHGTGVGARP